MSFVTQLPWVIIWIVILIYQDMNLKKGKGFVSLICIWVALILSFVWDPAVNLLLGENAAAMQFGSRFWLLFVITAIIHVLNARKQKRAAQKPAGAPDQEITQVEEPEE